MRLKISEWRRHGREILAMTLIIGFGIGAMVFAVIGTAQTRMTDANASAITAASSDSIPRATVRGRIVYEDNERPLRRQSFYVSSASYGSANSNVSYSSISNMSYSSNSTYFNGSGMTDANGDFELRNVPPGKYYLRVEAPNVLNGYGGNMTMSSIAATGGMNEFIVPGGGEVGGISIRVKRGGAVGGKVAYADGDAAIGIRVDVLPKLLASGNSNSSGNDMTSGNMSMSGKTSGGYYSNYTARTDDRGVYRIIGLPAGDYIVRVTERTSHDGNSTNEGYSSMVSSFLALFYSGATEASKATNIRVEHGQETPDVDFLLPERNLYKVSGKIVVRGSNQIVEGARLSLKMKTEKTDDGGYNGVEAMTKEIIADARGEFYLKDLPSAKYLVAVKPPYDHEKYGDDGKQVDESNRPSVSSVDKEFEITGADIGEFLIEMPPGASLSGKIALETGRELPSTIGITFFDEKGEESLNDYLPSYDEETGRPKSRTSADFKIKNIKPGKYAVNVYVYDEAEEETGKMSYYLKSIKSGGREVTLPLEIKEGENIADLMLTLGNNSGTVKGIVRDKNNQPAGSRRLLLASTEPSNWYNFDYLKFSQSEANGAYEFKAPPGDYALILATAEDERRLTKSHESYLAYIREKIAAAQKITIKANQTETVNLTVP